MPENVFTSISAAFPDQTVEQAEELLRRLLGASSVTLYREGRDVRSDTSLRVLQGLGVEMRAVFDDDGGTASQASQPPRSDTQNAPTRGPDRASSDPLLERFVQAMEAQERQRGFVWAGYVIKDLLPGLGLADHEAQALFNRLSEQGVVLLEKRPNPKNPDFPSTGVRLNRDHPVVQDLVQRAGRPFSFKPITIRGEPLSATIIRERR